MKDFIINSKLINEWHLEKNDKLGFYPDKITLGSGKKVWWKCKHCGHEWQAIVCDRNHGKGCPKCAKYYQTSSQEMKLYYYVRKYFTDAVSGYSDKQNGITEIDVYIPSLSIGIEYDGATWHQKIENDLYKDNMCKQNNITLIRIREPKCPIYQSDCVFINMQNLSQDELRNSIFYVLEILHVNNIDIDFDRDLYEIEKFISYNRIENSLAEKFPDIAAEWHPTKNGSLKPENVSSCSEKRIWWLCPRCGHEYVTTVSNRTDKHSGCSKCVGNYAKQVYCPELGKIFISTGEAERQTGVFHGHISRCINGKLKHAGRHPVTGERLTWKEII